MTSLSIKSFLYPLLSHSKTRRTLKYIIYGSLILNLGRYFYDDYLAMLSALPPDASLKDYSTQFSTTIDMLAWVALVFIFELETFAIPDEKWTKTLTFFMRGTRSICYIAIIFSAYGYTVEALENFDTTEVLGITNTCQLADQEASLQINVFAYEKITPENCKTLSDDTKFFQISNEISYISESTLDHVKWIQLIDIDNAFIWLIVVLLIEFEVWMKSREKISTPILKFANIFKTFCYVILIGNMLIWLFTDYYLYAWDAFLWIFGFWAIELNLAEWEAELKDNLNKIN